MVLGLSNFPYLSRYTFYRYHSFITLCTLILPWMHRWLGTFVLELRPLHKEIFHRGLWEFPCATWIALISRFFMWVSIWIFIFIRGYVLIIFRSFAWTKEEIGLFVLSLFLRFLRFTLWWSHRFAIRIKAFHVFQVIFSLLWILIRIQIIVLFTLSAGSSLIRI